MGITGIGLGAKGASNGETGLDFWDGWIGSLIFVFVLLGWLGG
jgi:hypothetical protein